MQNVLVRMPSWIGDFVMAIPLLLDLRKNFPQASITALCTKGLEELLLKESAVDAVFKVSSGLGRSGSRKRPLYDLVGKIEAGKFDAAILTTRSMASAWAVWRGGVKRRVGYFAGWPYPLFLTDPLDRKEEHQISVYKRLLSPFGIEESKTAPRLVLDQEEREDSSAFLERFGVKKGAKIIGIHPGAAYGSAKCWPPERFRDLTEHLLKTRGESIVFFGDEAGRGLIEGILREFPSERVVSLAGKTSLRRLACLIERTSLFISNDSGPMHIAAALKRPLIALFGSTDPQKTSPLGEGTSVVLYKGVPCSPCFKRTCPIDFRCMLGISVEEVASHAQKLLEEFSLPSRSKSAPL